MNLLIALLTQLLHLGLMLVAAPTVAGALDWVDARMSGRTGPPILAPWHDLVKLSRKTPMAIESASRAAPLLPALGLGATLSAAALVPSFALGMALAPLADVLVIVSLLALARIAAGLADLDSGAALPGLAAQDAGALAVLAEPALMLAVVTLALIGGSFNLDLIIGQQREGLLLPEAASTVTLTAMLALLFADAGAGGDGLAQLAGGTALAIAQMTVWLRRLVWINLIGGLFLPIGIAAAHSLPLAWLIGLAAWAVKLAAFVLGLAAIRARLGRVPHRLLFGVAGIAMLLALVAAIMVLASAGTA